MELVQGFARRTLEYHFAPARGMMRFNGISS